MPQPTVRILLVEDSPSDAELLVASLSEGGLGCFNLTHVERFSQALEHLAQDLFDVLLLDLSLPDSTGRETFQQARAAAPHLPIVVLTSVEDEVVGLEAVRQGVQDYLIKSEAHGRQTARAIRYAIERKQVEQELKQTEAALRESEQRLREWNTELESRVKDRTAQLQETISNLEDFSHSITHDLRAPLRAMRAFSQILQEECGASASPVVQDCLQRIMTSAARMDRLIQDVLQYSQVSRGELALAPVEVSALLRGILESYPAFQPGVVDIRIEGTLPRVLGNEAALTQCVSNLLDNAVKFVAPGVRPRICIWAEPVDLAPAAPSAESATRNPRRAAGFSTVRLWFADNGIGIPEEARGRIFDMFQQLDKHYEGTGVGLAVVRKAVEKMGGTVGVTSDPAGGSRFWLELKTAATISPASTPSSSVKQSTQSVEPAHST